MISVRSTISLFASLLALSAHVNAHGFITDVQGANGKKGQGFGVNLSAVTPGNQGPTSVFNGGGPCGRGVTAGNINVQAEIEKAIRSGLPTVGANGEISMNWQQVNAGADGGGPGTAAIDVTGTGNNFKPLQITKDFGDGGNNSRNPMTVKLAPGTTCTGGSTKNACLIKVTNAAGPFGSCIAVQSPGGGGGAAPPPANNGGNNGGGGAAPPAKNGGNNGGGAAPPPARNGGNNGGGAATPPPANNGGNQGGNNGACKAKVVVKAGDNCGKIARSKNIAVNKLVQLNPGVNAGCTNLRVGQELCVDAGNKQRRTYNEFASSMQAKRAWVKMTLVGQ